MRFASTILALAALALPGAVTAAQEPAAAMPQESAAAAPSAATADGDSRAADAALVHRVDLPTLAELAPFPYTFEVPTTWHARRDLPIAEGVVVGPPAADPRRDSDLVFVRRSQVDLSDPEAVIANIRRNDEAAPWSAPETETVTFGDVVGVWILMEVPATESTEARKTLTLKLPLETGSVDIMATAPAADFEALRPRFERILRSVQPAETGEMAEPDADA